MAKQKEEIAAGKVELKQQSDQLSVQAETLLSQKSEIALNADEIKTQEETIAGQDKTLRSQQATIDKNADVITEQQDVLEELTLKVEDVESLIDDVSQIAYDKAVDVVADRVRRQTTKENLAIIDKYQKSLNQSDRKVRPVILKAMNTALESAKTQIQCAASRIQKKIMDTLKKPEIRSANVEPVRENARKSVLAKLKKSQADVDRREKERGSQNQQHTKQNMER